MYCLWRCLRIYYGTDFPLAFALTVPQAGMRLRDIKPQCPEQNGKVERSHRIDEEEFWSRSSFGSFASAAETWRAWDRRSNHERFSMALSGLTPVAKLATFTTASSPFPSGTASPNRAQPLTSAMDRRLIAAPEPNVRAVCSHNHDLHRGGHFLTSHYIGRETVPQLGGGHSLARGMGGHLRRSPTPWDDA